MEKFKIIDAHTHCLDKADLKAEFFWFSKNYDAKLRNHAELLRKNNIDKALVYILDERAVDMDCRVYSNLIMGILIDFRKSSAVNQIKKAKKSGFKGIKILTYEQQVEKNDYVSILKLAKEVEKQKMFLTICATFGGKDPYKHDALALARYIVKNGFKSSLILAHAGGSRIKEAVLIADSYPDVYFDTSFTTTFWHGSTVIDDLVFAIKKYPNRFFFGSDSPYVSFLQAKKDSRLMLKGVSKNLKKKYFYTNIFNFLKKYE